MSAIGKLRIIESAHLAYCPGCAEYHKIGNNWTFNGDHDRPTFSPSIIVRGENVGKDSTPTICHSFLIDGIWQYLHDSTHELAGIHVPLRSEY